MSKVVMSSDLSNINSKVLIRAKVKDYFSEFSEQIFGIIEESGTMTNKDFETLSGLSVNFYNEYCNQLKALFEAPSSIIMGKRSVKNFYITYNNKVYTLTQQGITEKAPITIAKFTGTLPSKETLHDLEKACLKLRFNQ